MPPSVKTNTKWQKPKTKMDKMSHIWNKNATWCHFLHLCAMNERKIYGELKIVSLQYRWITWKGRVLSFDIFESSDLWLVEWARFKFLAIWGIWWGCYWIKRLAHHLQGLPSGMGGAAPTGEFAPSSPSRRGDSLPGPWMVTPSCWASSSWSA